MHSATVLAILSFGLTPLVSAHCKITSATGDQGGKASGLGITMATGTNQGDTTIFNQKTGFGKTNKGGAIKPATAVAASMKFVNSNQLPQVSEGGQLSITMHQLNGDGAGPLTCAMSTDATGQNWQNIQVTQQMPGTKGRSKANNQDFQVAAAIPAGTTCTGAVDGQTGVCMVKCQNPVGPFGGTVAIQMAGANATAADAAGAAGTAGTTGTTGATTGTTAAQGTTQAANGATTAQGTTSQGTTKGAAQGTTTQGTTKGATQGTAAQGTTAQGTTAQGTTSQGTAAQGTTTQGTTSQGTTAQGNTSQSTTSQGTAAQAATGAKPSTAAAAGGPVAQGTTASTATTGTNANANTNANNAATKTTQKSKVNARDEFSCDTEECLNFDDSADAAEKRDVADLECTDAACAEFNDSDSTAEKKTKRTGPVAVRSLLMSESQ